MKLSQQCANKSIEEGKRNDAHRTRQKIDRPRHANQSGTFASGVEYKNAYVSFSTQLLANACEQLSLGYVNPADIDVAAWQNREDEGILYVPKAGEVLYRVRK